jgi:hypothetical protein
MKQLASKADQNSLKMAKPETLVHSQLHDASMGDPQPQPPVTSLQNGLIFSPNQN